MLFDTASLGASLEAGCGQSLAFFSDCIEPHFQRVICYYPFLGLRRRVLVKRDFVAENPYNILTRMPGYGSKYLRYTA